jgi:DNA polymerase elongation subunit (family B)
MILGRPSSEIEKEWRGDFNKQTQFNINTTDKTFQLCRNIRLHHHNIQFASTINIPVTLALASNHC